MDVQLLWMTAARAAGVYVLVLVVLRMIGKRTIGNFSAFDLLVALMVGEVVDEMIYGDVTFLQGAIPIVVVALLHEANAWLSYWDHGMDRILEGAPTTIVADGKLVRRGMRTERMNEKDVMHVLRLEGIEDMREVKLAVVETDGQVSVVKHDWAEPAQKSDLGGAWEEERQRAIGGREEPTPRRRTISPQALGQRG